MTGKEFLTDAAALIEQYRLSVREDLEAVPEERFWQRPVPGQVSPANLALHLSGNLRHFFGHLLGGTDYRRDRPREFADEPWAEKGAVLALWELACTESRGVLLAMEEDALGTPAPVAQYPGGVPVRAFILRLLGHLTYHAGQIRTHRRMLAPPPQ